MNLPPTHSLALSGRFERLRENIMQALGGSISEPELTELVHFSRVLIESHLRSFRPASAMLCRSHGITVTDLACDCIADAFARNEEFEFCNLQSLVATFRQPIEQLPAHEVFLAYKGFLIKFADSQLARLFALSDPAGAKIHRNIRDCLKSGRYFTVRREFRGLILTPKSHDPLDEYPPYPFEELNRCFADAVDGQTMIPDLLGLLHTILCKQRAYRRCIPMAHAVQLFKTVFRADGDEAEMELSIRTELEGLSEFEIERMRGEVERALKEKIVVTYLTRGKMDRAEAEAIFKAFHDLLLEWCSADGDEMSLAGYLGRHMKLEGNAYESTYRIKMEYLLKIVREEFGSRLLREM